VTDFVIKKLTVSKGKKKVTKSKKKVPKSLKKSQLKPDQLFSRRKKPDKEVLLKISLTAYNESQNR
jgi:hypothetical protein